MGWLRRLFGLGSKRTPRSLETYVFTDPVVREKITVIDPDTGLERAVDSLDDLSPELREAAQKAIEDGRPVRGTVVSSTSLYTFTDADGNTQTFERVEDMPPDVRRFFEKRGS